MTGSANGADSTTGHRRLQRPWDQPARPSSRRLVRYSDLHRAAEPSTNRHSNGAARAKAGEPRAAARLLRPGGPPLLRTEDVTVRFGGLIADKEVSVEVREGAVTALIGPNGAGKTTFFNVLSGAQAPTSGRVEFAGTDITGRSRSAVVGCGIARTFQNLQLFELLSVQENVMLGASRFGRAGIIEEMVGAPRARRDVRRLREAAARAIEFVGLTDVADERAADLPYGLRRRTEIARALAAGPRILLLDEPSAGMDPGETAELGQLISDMVDRMGLTVFLVEHDMSMVRSYVDFVYVLEFGELIAWGDPATVLSDQKVIDAYLGSREATRA